MDYAYSILCRFKETAMRKLYLACLLLCSSLASAAVLNVEFHFTPFTGDTAADHVQTVAGQVRVFINNVLHAEQAVESHSVPVLFSDRQIAAPIWVPVASIGPAVRKGRNTIRIEFEPSDAKTPYRAQLRWATVTDQVKQESAAGSFSATNQSDEGMSAQQGSGKLVFEHEFVADFATDLPWHHSPPITALSEVDKQALAALVKARVTAFKPTFAGVYQALESRKGIDAAGIKKTKCLDKAYAAGVRIAAPPPEQLDFLLTGNPEVIVRGKTGNLYPSPDQKTFARIKGEDMQMCAGVALAVTYPPQLAVIRTPSGAWEVVY